MITARRRAVLALALSAVLSLGAAPGALAGPKAPPRPSTPVAAATVAPQVLLRVVPVETTVATTDFVATVTVKAPRGAFVSGTYELRDGSTVVAGGALVGGVATVALELVEGRHRLVAVYSAPAKKNGASSKLVTVTVAPAVV